MGRTGIWEMLCAKYVTCMNVCKSQTLARNTLWMRKQAQRGEEAC